jgi:hypothetical protein
MQVLCKSTSHSPDLCCTVCGQGFLLVLERPSRAERAHALREIAKILRNHHHTRPGRHAHPENGFLIPGSNSSSAFSGAAISGNAPSWAL